MFITSHQTSRVNEEDNYSSELNAGINVSADEIKINLTNINEYEFLRETPDFRKSHILTYSIVIGALLILTLTRSYSFFKMCLKISQNLHEKLFASVTRATMYFFNRNPSGRILNRFAQDVALIDTKLTVALVECITVSEL